MEREKYFEATEFENIKEIILYYTRSERKMKSK